MIGVATSVAITGHTRGIGRGIAEEFKNRNWDVIGFSRSNGFDIAEHDCISRMISVVKENDCDVVVINAYHGFMQIHQLFEFSKLWEHDVNKTIITIGSTSGTEWRRPYPYKYGVAKLALDTAVENLQFASKCRILHIRPGYVDTDFVANTNWHKMPVSQVVSAVFWMFDQPSTVLVKSLTIDPRPNQRIINE